MSGISRNAKELFGTQTRQSSKSSVIGYSTRVETAVQLHIIYIISELSIKNDGGDVGGRKASAMPSPAPRSRAGGGGRGHALFPPSLPSFSHPPPLQSWWCSASAVILDGQFVLHAALGGAPPHWEPLPTRALWTDTQINGLSPYIYWTTWPYYFLRTETVLW